MKQTFGGPLLVTGYAKHLPVSEKPYTIRVNELPTDGFNDCTSTGAYDAASPGTDLLPLQPDNEGFGWYESYSSTMNFYGESSLLGKSIVVYAPFNSEIP